MLCCLQQQHGYCLLQPSFQYRDSALYYTTAGGEQRQYVSNCNVLCRRCRYQRFLLAQQGAQQVRREELGFVLHMEMFSLQFSSRRRVGPSVWCAALARV